MNYGEFFLFNGILTFKQMVACGPNKLSTQKKPFAFSILPRLFASSNKLLKSDEARK
jgi:hypothetical protein